MKNNKKRSVVLRVTSFMLTMLLISSMAMPAFANEDNFAKGDPDTGKSAVAKITKVLDMPIGTTTPTATFTFKFKPETVEGKPYNSTNKNMPLIEDIDIVIDSTAALDTTSPSGVKTVYKESADILSSLIGSWPHAGSFKYTVTEIDGTYAIAPDNKKEWMTYSLSEFEVEFIVDNSPDGGLYVLYIVATHTKDDKGEEITGGEKVNPNPGGGDNDIYSQFKFVNTYSKTTGGGEENPKDSVLDISNTVKGTGVNLLGTYFNFSVTVNKPDVGYVAPYYMVYVIEKDTIVSDLKDNVLDPNLVDIDTDKNGIQYFKFVPGTSADVLLRHDQKLGFADVTIGASFKVTLAATQGFYASYKMSLNGGPETEDANRTDNTPLTAPKTGFAYIGESKNRVDYLNDREFTAPTGVNINDLPYYVLIAIAAIALIAFVAIKNSFNYASNGA